MSDMIRAPWSDWTPTTTRSGRMKSSIAAPSRRNSGFEATSNSRSGFAARTVSATLRLVPTGTVDLVTMTTPGSATPATSSAAAMT